MGCVGVVGPVDVVVDPPALDDHSGFEAERDLLPTGRGLLVASAQARDGFGYPQSLSFCGMLA